MSLPNVDNIVLKWYSQLIPILDIPTKEKDNSAGLIKTFIERCKHACSALNEDQKKMLLFTITSRMSDSVVQNINKYEFDSIDELERCLKEAYPNSSSREYILDEIRQCRQRDGEIVEDFVGRLKDLLRKGRSEDSEDTEYEKAAIIALKKGIHNDVVYVQLSQLGTEASFEQLAIKAIAAEQDFRMRNRKMMHSNNNSSNSLDSDLIDQFKRILTALESKTVDHLESNRLQDNPKQAEAYQQAYQSPPRNQYKQQKPLYRPKLCYNCGKPRHFIRDCRLKGQSFGYFQPGYLPSLPNSPINYQPNNYQTNNNNNYKSNSNNQNTNPNQNLSTIVEICAICGLQGHNASSCVRNLPGTSPPCQLCDNIGHIAKYCPLLKQGNFTGSAQ